MVIVWLIIYSLLKQARLGRQLNSLKRALKVLKIIWVKVWLVDKLVGLIKVSVISYKGLKLPIQKLKDFKKFWWVWVRV